MKKTPKISDAKFEALLNWLSADSELAGVEFERIREGLVRYFRYRGCVDSIGLADETMNRVIKKIDTLDLEQPVDNITIFYGFAKYVHHEYLRDNNGNHYQLNEEFPIKQVEEITATYSEKELICLDNCLNELSVDEKKLIVKYFSKEKDEKILLRKKIMKDLGINANTLHVRVYRIKERLKKCVQQGLSEKKL